MSKARVLVAKKGVKSIIGRGWRSALKSKIEQSMIKVENTVNSISHKNVESDIKLSPAADQLVEEFPNLVEKRGRVNNYQIEIEMKDGRRATEQKNVEYHYSYKNT